MAALLTGTVTFLFADIDGSTELLQRLGDSRFAEILAEHRRLLREALILFDGVCNLCNAWVNFVIDHDRAESFFFGAQQSAGGQAILGALHLKGQDLAGIILVVGSRVYIDSTAILEICARLPRPWKYVALLRLIPRPFRDAVYRWLARHRYKWFGRSAACRVPTPQLQRRFLA
jgi:predicted DCC family thiol-disulfide oxidoreductase YuxK